MARLPRIVIPGQPIHLVQRGNNRSPCFFTDEDYDFYLDCLGEAARHFGCHLHAYVLMTNHVHLLLTPDASFSVAHMMQSIGRRYVRHVNCSYRRSGTLWEGRYKSAPIDSAHYFLACCRYLDLNPVRANIVKHPKHYRWSSYRAYAEGIDNGVISPHPLYLQLSVSPEGRRAAYRALFTPTTDEVELDAIRASIGRGTALGNAQFRHEIESNLKRRVTRLSLGGDRKSAAFKARQTAKREFSG